MHSATIKNCTLIEERKELMYAAAAAAVNTFAIPKKAKERFYSTTLRVQRGTEPWLQLNWRALLDDDLG